MPLHVNTVVKGRVGEQRLKACLLKLIKYMLFLFLPCRFILAYVLHTQWNLRSARTMALIQPIEVVNVLAIQT